MKVFGIFAILEVEKCYTKIRASLTVHSQVFWPIVKCTIQITQVQQLYNEAHPFRSLVNIVISLYAIQKHYNFSEIHLIQLSVTRPANIGHVGTNYTPLHNRPFLSTGTEHLYSVSSII